MTTQDQDIERLTILSRRGDAEATQALYRAHLHRGTLHQCDSLPVALRYVRALAEASPTTEDFLAALRSIAALPCPSPILALVIGAHTLPLDELAPWSRSQMRI